MSADKDIQHCEDGLVPATVAVERAEPSIMSIIADAARNPSLEAVAVIERLVALQERQQDRAAKTAYIAAMGRVAPKLLPVSKSGYNDHQKKPYVMLEDIDVQIRPLLAEEGLSMSFDSAPVEGRPTHMRFFCTNSHREGHCETKQIDLEVDKSGSKNGTQAGVSTMQYARR